MSEFLNIFIDLLNFLWGIAKVLVPIMIAIEIFKDTKLIDKISNFINPISKFFTLNKISGISLMLGIIFGLTYGAGAILQSVKDYNVDKRSIILIVMFISPCHAVFEDTLIMKAAGANILPLLAARFLSAIIITFILSRVMKREPLDAVKLDEH